MGAIGSYKNPQSHRDDHSRTKARHPQTNGICERFHRTIQEEFYATAFRKKLYTSLEELQADLDGWLDEYNRTRPHSGKYCYGKTPMQTFVDSLSLAREKMLDASYESGAEQAVREKLLCEGRWEGGEEEGAAAPSAA